MERLTIAWIPALGLAFFAAAVPAFTQQLNSPAQQPVPQTPAGKLPSNARLQPITLEEMQNYDRLALATAEVRVSPIVRSARGGFESIDPTKLQTLQQQKLSAPSMRIRSAATPSSTQHASQGGGIPSVAPRASGMSMLATPQPGSSPNTLMSASTNTGTSASHPGSSPGTVVTRSKPALGSTLPNLNKVPYVCQSPTIFSVNHLSKNAIFTPQVEYNAYVIQGCMFGQQTGKAYLIGKFNAVQVNLQPQFWSDTEIDARVDPNISGELDQQNVSLVIAPVGSGEIKATGFEFVAARSNPPVLLSSIPKAWLSSSGWNGSFVNPALDIESPVTPGSNAPKSLKGYTVYVVRKSNHKFSPGTDMYNPQLAPGWTFDSVQLAVLTFPPSCPGVVTYRQTFGTAAANLSALPPDWTKTQRSAVRISGYDTSCSGFIPIAPPLIYSTYSDSTGSAYGIKVWVSGPRCTDPFTGVPDPQCISNMQHCGQQFCNQ